MTINEYLQKLNVKFLSEYSWEEIEHRLNTYFKFIVVRDPLKRFLSAYKDKFEKRGHAAILFDRYKTFINKANGITDIHSDRNISFPEFTKYVTDVYKESLKFVHNSTFNGINMDMLDPGSEFFERNTVNRTHAEGVIQGTEKTHLKGLRLLDVHWARYSSMCHPCLVNYDYIANLDTLEDDAPFILKQLGFTGDPLNFISEKHPKTTDSKEIKYYGQLTTQQIDTLKTIYKNDLKLFGFE